MTLLTWFGILFCLSQSAILSGLNLALFSLSRLELEVEAKTGNPWAKRILGLRENANFALVTILWGNVAVNVLLALLSGSVLSGVLAFLFSTVIITVFAEIIPQAYFTRHVLSAGGPLTSVIRLYQVILYPIARPTAWVLDMWLGGEAVRYFPERDLRQVIRLHMDAAESENARFEGQGTLNFLELDDVRLDEEGEPLDPDSVLSLPFDGDQPVFPNIEPTTNDDFLRAVNRSGRSWVVIVDENGAPRFVLRADNVIREALFLPHSFNPMRHCHRPIVVHDRKTKLGELIPHFRLRSSKEGDDVLEQDLILLWENTSRLVTGTDILGRLLRGIATPSTAASV